MKDAFLFGETVKNMKIAGLIIGILLMVLAGIGGIACFMLPSLTNNRVKFDEAMLGLIPAAIVLIFGFVVTLIAAVLVLKARKKVAQ